jgi:multidrug efflux pump subunit AcrA (membrane-fusion protein)
MNVRPGMTAKVGITLPGEEVGGAISVPAHAVVDDGSGAPFVWRIDPTTLSAARADVSLGELSGDRIEIRSGLAAGDQIAVSGVHQLRDGMNVRRYTE